ncbi:MAG TPA: hypothetical protein VIJ14_11090 [Rhabdochlamydiaceae bacterium]
MSFLTRVIVLFFGMNVFFADPCFALTRFSEQAQFYSQAAQDKFVWLLLYGFLNKQDKGHYLEIGAHHPIEINNTYFFEKNLGWEGVSIDISDDHKNLWQMTRRNTLLIEDATKSDYRTMLKSFPKEIDYLSIDIDRHYDLVLQRIPFDEHIFKVITIEHDFYGFGDEFRQKERSILAPLGYYLLCPDVSNQGNIYEDWWIHPSAFPEDVLAKLLSLDLKTKEHGPLIKIIQEHMHSNGISY